LNEPPRFFETAVTALHIEDSEYVSSLPDNFYSSDHYASKLISYLSDRTYSEKEKPFFAYLPFSAPHWPLQAPLESVEKYKGIYSDGPNALRLRRLERLKALGFIKPDIIPHEMVVTEREPPEWANMTEAERAKSARAMETYAGMVSRMDENIGRVLDHLRQTGEYDNTYIFFMSDNGAEGASYEAAPILGDEVVAHINRYYNNSLDNIGRANSFVWYGSRWAQAATAPSRLYKMFSTQGGCRVPLVLKPAKLASTDKSAGNHVTDAFCTVMDIVPTILDLAGLEHPGSMYRGRQIAPLRGKSWKVFLDAIPNGDAENATFRQRNIHGDDEVTGWEVAGSGALRRGRYKITYVPLPKGPQRWELFDIETDPGETVDISAEKSDIFEELLRLWDIYKDEVGVVGLAGELNIGHKPRDVTITDEFEDTGRWIRFIGKKEVPPRFANAIPI
jgi:arylsulfatase A-like enzyme